MSASDNTAEPAWGAACGARARRRQERMRIALSSDEPYPVHATVRALLAARGHEVVPFGAVADGKEGPWALAAERAAQAVASGACDEGIFFCWTGTGISIAANKV